MKPRYCSWDLLPRSDKNATGTTDRSDIDDDVRGSMKPGYGGGAAGRLTVNVVPTPSVDFTATVPPNTS